MTHQTQKNTRPETRNTISGKPEKRVSRARGWSFTIWNIDTVPWRNLKSFKCDVIGFQTENAPTTGNEHIQGFVYFKNPRSKKSIDEMLGTIDPKIYVRKFTGSLTANVRYCTESTKKKPDGEPGGWNKRVRYFRRNNKIILDIDNSEKTESLQNQVSKIDWKSDFINKMESLIHKEVKNGNGYIHKDMYKSLCKELENVFNPI